MKALNNILKVCSALFAFLSFGMFFVNYATVTNTGNSYSAAQFAWGMAGDIKARSAQIAFCMIISLIAVACAIVAAIKKGGWRYAAPGFGIVTGVYTLIIALSSPDSFIDVRPLTNAGLEHTPIALLLAIAALIATACGVGYLFTSDYLEVIASNGSKMFLGKRIVKFFRDYRGEVKKIYWPNIQTVAKNTLIVLIMCALVGAFIWLLDLGLGELINLILGV